MRQNESDIGNPEHPEAQSAPFGTGQFPEPYSSSALQAETLIARPHRTPSVIKETRRLYTNNSGSILQLSAGLCAANVCSL